MSRLKELKVLLYPKSTGATWSGFGCHLLKDDLKYIQEGPGLPATQSVACGPAAAASHGKMLETQPLRIHPEALTQDLHFNQNSKWFMHTSQLEKH